MAIGKAKADRGPRGEAFPREFLTLANLPRS